MHCVYVNTVKTKINEHKTLNAMYVDTFDTGVCVFTQHCIQSNEVSKLNSTLYIGLLPLQKGGLIVAISPVGFKYLLTSQSKEAALLTF